ncbi:MULTISPECIES: hypothetical protein [Vibrio]|jgi:hypothetical protein|uniref:Uncharacterized protein n=1 Tax=Vibrio jasicida TaxID=766224 RepID=A0AAU9QLQ3_9VIBR|nr:MULTISPECIES: hypothetical protein [Vibrio]MCZ2799151.1 hypothetical protein [Vibrio alginolyticus]CAH1583053.1 hypothetical protein THF1A12_190050 [Vibrio jasicida]CAH1596234.1 hypothetical protein THF1C08_40049 [Vibrio jasicida]
MNKQENQQSVKDTAMELFGKDMTLFEIESMAETGKLGTKGWDIYSFFSELVARKHQSA